MATTINRSASVGSTSGRFDFGDGGSYTGGYSVDGAGGGKPRSHGLGVSVGPAGRGQYAGAWSDGYETSGVYAWTGGGRYEGQWLHGRRHGLGVEARCDGGAATAENVTAAPAGGVRVYRGEWTAGYRGRYGVRQASTTGLKYEGTWATGLQDGYGVETYPNGGE